MPQLPVKQCDEVAGRTQEKSEEEQEILQNIFEKAGWAQQVHETVHVAKPGCVASKNDSVCSCRGLAFVHRSKKGVDVRKYFSLHSTDFGYSV